MTDQYPTPNPYGADYSPFYRPPTHPGYHNEPPKPPKNRTGLKLFGGVVAGLAVLAMIGSAIGSSDEESTAAPTTSAAPITTAASYTTPFSVPTSRIAPPPVAKDPLKTSGTWLIGKDIQPGDYAVTPTRQSSIFNDGEPTGYWALCADFGCEVDFDGSDATGMITNELVTAPGYVTIPASAHSIQLDDVELTPVG